jgi:hypothetical protein
MTDFSKLGEFSKGVRPVGPDSLPFYLDVELDRISVVLREMREALQNLDERLTLLEP